MNNEECNYSIGKAVEILHKQMPITEHDVFHTFDNENKYINHALLTIYKHFGHRTDGQDKPCLICDGNPNG